MKVKEIMAENIISLSTGDEVSKLISLIEKYRFREVPIINRKILKGIVYAKDIASKGVRDPSNVKISSIMRYNTTNVSPDTDIKDAANLIFETGLRALPVVEDKKVIGIVSMHDIIVMASNTNQFKKTKIEEVMSIPETITSETDIGKARVFMRERNISRLPIVDDEKRLIGVVTIFDMLKSVKDRERIDFFSMTSEKERVMGIPISTIMNTNPITISKNESLADVVNLIKKYKLDGTFVVEKNIPIGVITEKDLLEIYISGLKKSGIYYQIIGMKDEDDFTVSTVERMVNDTLTKLTKLFNPQFFFLHVKKYEERGGRTKYSIRTRFGTSRGIFITKSHAWDLRDAVDEALSRLERISIKDREKTRDKIIGARTLKKLQE